jgi:hypothetical protein
MFQHIPVVKNTTAEFFRQIADLIQSCPWLNQSLIFLKQALISIDKPDQYIPSIYDSSGAQVGIVKFRVDY